MFDFFAAHYVKAVVLLMLVFGYMIFVFGLRAKRESLYLDATVSDSGFWRWYLRDTLGVLVMRGPRRWKKKEDALDHARKYLFGKYDIKER